MAYPKGAQVTGTSISSLPKELLQTHPQTRKPGTCDISPACNGNFFCGETNWRRKKRTFGIWDAVGQEPEIESTLRVSRGKQGGGQC